MELLKLAALDQDDLEVVSAHMQDAIVAIADMRYMRPQHKFVLLANRFAWDALIAGKRQTYQRRRSGLQFARVRSVKCQGIGQTAGEGLLCLLSIGFEPGDLPSGIIRLNFSGGATIKLDVECIEAQLDDLGPAWETGRLPSHEGQTARTS
jgi:hypothetical protein